MGGGGLGVSRFRWLAEMLWLAAERALNEGVWHALLGKASII